MSAGLPDHTRSGLPSGVTRCGSSMHRPGLSRQHAVGTTEQPTDLAHALLVMPDLSPSPMALPISYFFSGRYTIWLNHTIDIAH